MAAIEGIEQPEDTEVPPPDPSLDELRNAISAARQSKIIYEKAADSARRRQDTAEQDSKRAQDARDSAHRETEEARRQLRELQEQTATLKASSEAMDAREQTITTRELAAEAGFREQQEKVTAEQRRELDRVSQEISTAWEVFAAQQDEERQRIRERLEREHADRTADIEVRERDLSEQATAFAKQRGQLRAEAGRLEVKAEDLTAERDRLELRVRAVAGRELDDLRQQLATAQALVEVANQEADRVRQQMTKREREWAAFGGLGAPDTYQRLREVEDNNAALRDELAQRPAMDAVRHLREIADAHRGCEAQLEDLRYAKSRLEAEIGATKLGVADLERLRDSESSYRLIIDAYKASVRDLEDRYGELTERKSRVSAFPSCSRLDADPGMRIPLRTAADPPDLADLVGHVQSLMAHAPEPRQYDDRNVRSFLAGLATSHLHLLEGISGTGKTSLPRAFAMAIGAGHDLVEVQAGWRDRHDLFGYYNTFERTFHETKFLKALYTAGLPAFANRPFFIVLDEMNLSHVEYYFADLLSKLENPDGKPIELLPAPVGEPPQRLVGGTGIRLPDNVWFIGTANNDETTLTFADKTYDRAYLLELPATRVSVKTEPRPALTPLSTQALTVAFDRAKADHKEDAEKVLAFFNTDLRPALQRLCGIGWGPRLEEQTRAYVAVVRGAGGTMEEAADHVLATKLLRKVRGRYQIRGEQLSNVKDVVLRSWKQAGLRGDPGASITLLADEKLKR
ncbi:hypothetical protein [Parafrankia sp. FMc2]|uniref:hypothetical protein n=1 Tax=Parafrankia sp. FMc2 TaxID=3233196 RepID=UPI0034D66179